MQRIFGGAWTSTDQMVKMDKSKERTEEEGRLGGKRVDKIRKT